MPGIHLESPSEEEGGTEWKYVPPTFSSLEKRLEKNRTKRKMKSVGGGREGKGGKDRSPIRSLSTFCV